MSWRQSGIYLMEWGNRSGSGTDNASDVSSPVLVSNLYTVLGIFD